MSKVGPEEDKEEWDISGELELPDPISRRWPSLSSSKLPPERNEGPAQPEFQFLKEVFVLFFMFCEISLISKC